LQDDSMALSVVRLNKCNIVQFSPSAGKVMVGTTMTMHTDTSGAKIIYCMDTDYAHEPEEGSPDTKVYGKPIILNTVGRVLFHARALKSGMLSSNFSECEVEVVEAVKEKKKWTLWDSIWVPRAKGPIACESKDFFDSAKVIKRQFNLDWSRCIEKNMFKKFLTKLVMKATGGTEDDAAAEIEEIKGELWEDFNTISACFDFYSACSSGDGFEIKLNAFSDFLDDCEIPDSGKNAPCNQMVLDTIFKAVNYEEDKKSDLSSVNDDHALMRMEFLEAAVRIGLAKYYPHKCTDPSEAINKLSVDNILPNLESAATHDKNKWRQERLYTEDMDNVYRGKRFTIEPAIQVLKSIYEIYCKAKPGSKAYVMSISEWCQFLDEVDMIDQDFTKREARLCFTWAKMKCSDEAKNRLKVTTMNFMDFLEGCARVSELKTIPTDEAMAALAEKLGEKCSNIVEYYKLPEADRVTEDDDLEMDYMPPDHATRPMTDRFEKFLQLLFSVYDQEGDGVISVADIKKHRQIIGAGH